MGSPEALGTGLIWHDRLRALADAPLQHFDAALGMSDTMAVVLDAGGRIVARSARWLDAARERGLDPRTVDVGADYLAPCDRAAADHGDEAAAVAADNIRAVLRGDRRQFTMDYGCPGPDQGRWFTLRVAQLVGPGSGALVTHLDITAVRGAELAVRGRLHALWNVVDPTADFVFVLDERGRVLGRTPDQSDPHQWPVVGEAAFDHLHPEDRESVLDLFAQLAATPGERGSRAFRAQAPGAETWRHFHATAVNLAHDPAIGGTVVAVVDVTKHIRSASEANLAAALSEDTAVTALTTDEKGVITAINAGARALLGVQSDDAMGRVLRDFVTPVSEEDATVMRQTIADGGEWSGELEVVRRDGSVVSAGMRVRALDDPLTGLRVRSYLALDHSQARELEASLRRHKREDAMTGLANRATMRKHLRDLCRSLVPGQEASVATLDIARFRDVNSLHGSDVGDAVLREVGSALQEAAGPRGCVARLYGDVFAVASAPGVDPDRFVDALQEAINVVHPSPVLAVQVTANVGLRVVRHADGDAEEIIADACLAAEVAKESRGSAVRRYDPQIRRRIDQRARLRADLATALDRDELTVAFQPIVRLGDGVVVGVEALLRWIHPTAGTVAPEDFIPLAEQTPVIHDIGAFVIEESCRHAARWQELRPELPVTVAVNLSASQLADATLTSRLVATLARHGLDPSNLMLELTESMFLDFEGGLGQMAHLKATGVRIAIDDFGTGYSSLSRLKELPLDVVKFDRGFITGIGRSPDDASIVRTVASLAEAIGVDVVAEGVETDDDAVALRAIGCNLGQGFLWAPPLPPGAIDVLLQRPFAAVVAPAPIDRSDEVGRAATEALRTIKHELATPLSVLSMTLDLKEVDGTMAADVVEAVTRNVQRVVRLADDLDLLEHVDKGTLRPRVEVVDLSVVVRDVVHRFRQSTGRGLDVRGQPRTPLRGDASLLDVAVANLVANALKYSPDPLPVSVHVSTDGEAAHVSVRDQGPGIPTERLGVIWRKFGRLAHGVPGSGIGLYIARGIARAHGGDLLYRPGDDGGSVFSLVVPTAPRSW